jgi:hypothetical protein
LVFLCPLFSGVRGRVGVFKETLHLEYGSAGAY